MMKLNLQRTFTLRDEDVSRRSGLFMHLQRKQQASGQIV